MRSPEVELLLAAAAESVEIEAFAFRRLEAGGRPLSASVKTETVRRLRARAPSATSWYPTYLGITHIPTGYGGLASTMSFRLSGLEITLDTLGADAGISAVQIRRLIENLPRVPIAKPTCARPFFTSARPLFKYLETRGRDLYRTSASRLALFSGLAASVDSPFDLACFMDLLAAFEFTNPADYASVVAYAVASMDRIEVPGCASEVLLQQFDFPGAVLRMAGQAKSLGVATHSVVLSYRSFVVRALGAPICSSAEGQKSPEQRARKRLVESANREIELSQFGDIPPISAEEIRRQEADRRVLDEKEPTYEIPSPVMSALRSLSEYVRNPSLQQEKPNEITAAMAELEYRWGLWEPAGAESDFREADGKVTALTTMCSVGSPQMCQRELPFLLSYLSFHRLKKEYPDIWVGYINTLLSLVSGGEQIGALRAPNPAARALFAKAPDRTIQLLARLP